MVFGYSAEKEKILNIGFTISLNGNEFDINRCYYTTHCEIAGQAFLPLVKYYRDGQITPGAALSWQIENKNKRIRFFIRQDLRWSDGSLVTSADFAEGIKRTLINGKQLESFRQEIVGWDEFVKTNNDEKLGIKAPDKFELTIDMIHSNGIDFRAFSSIQNIAIAKPDREEINHEVWANSTKKLSYGPYKIISIEENKIILEKNPFFHDLNSQMFDKIIYHGDIKRDSYEKYSANKIDILMGPKGKKLLWLNETYSNDIVNIGSPRVYTLYRNLVASRHLKKDVLSVLSATIDRKNLSESLFGKTARPLYGIIPTGFGGYTGLQGLEIKEKKYKTLVTQSRNKLVAAGYNVQNPVKVKVIVSENVPNYSQIAVFLKDNWEAIGIDAEFTVVKEFDKAAKVFKENNHDFMIASFVPDGGDIFEYLLILDAYSNFTGSKRDAEYLRLLQLARQGLYYKSFNDYVTDTDYYIVDNYFFIPIVYNNVSALVKSKITNIEHAVQSSMPRFHVSELRLKENTN